MKKMKYLSVLLFALIPLNVKANIVCNDGTISKSCQDCHQGCCSHHDGCITTSPNSNNDSKLTESTSYSSSSNSTNITSKSNESSNKTNSTSKNDNKSKKSLDSSVGIILELLLLGGGGTALYNIIKNKRK